VRPDPQTPGKTMTDTTTIQVRKDQAEQLQEIARENGNYKTVIDRLLESWEQSDSSDSDAIIKRIDDLENQLPRKVAEELQR